VRAHEIWSFEVTENDTIRLMIHDLLSVCL